MRVGLAVGREVAPRALHTAFAVASATVPWTAVGVDEAARWLRRDTPDVLVLCAGPGLELAETVRGLPPTEVPLVVVVADPARHVHEAFAASARGRLEVAALPTLDAAGTLRDPSGLVATLARLGRGRAAARPASAPSVTSAPVFLIAASAGGPEAVASVLAALPSTLEARVVIAQHIDAPFTSGLGEWLAARSGRRVEVAADGAFLRPDAALLVRSDRQPTIDAAGFVRYRALDPSVPFHPSIDALFESCARASSLAGVAALLTGMGEDGARGLLALRRAGWTTLAQDAESSRVFGMPRAAADLGAAMQVVPLAGVASAAVAALRRGTGARP